VSDEKHFRFLSILVNVNIFAYNDNRFKLVFWFLLVQFSFSFFVLLNI